jgi:hypothetical protein
MVFEVGDIEATELRDRLHPWLTSAVEQIEQLLVMESRFSPLTRRGYDLTQLHVPPLAWLGEPGSSENIFDIDQVLANLLLAAEFRARGRFTCVDKDIAESLVEAVLESPLTHRVLPPVAVPVHVLHGLQLHLAQVLLCAAPDSCRLSGYEAPRMPVGMFRELLSHTMSALLLLELHASSRRRT